MSVNTTFGWEAKDTKLDKYDYDRVFGFNINKAYIEYVIANILSTEDPRGLALLVFNDKDPDLDPYIPIGSASVPTTLDATNDYVIPTARNTIMLNDGTKGTAYSKDYKQRLISALAPCEGSGLFCRMAGYNLMYPEYSWGNGQYEDLYNVWNEEKSLDSMSHFERGLIGYIPSIFDENTKDVYKMVFPWEKTRTDLTDLGGVWTNFQYVSVAELFDLDLEFRERMKHAKKSNYYKKLVDEFNYRGGSYYRMIGGVLTYIYSNIESEAVDPDGGHAYYNVVKPSKWDDITKSYDMPWIPAGAIVALKQLLYRKYGRKWQTLWDAMLKEYNPIENYNMSESSSDTTNTKTKNSQTVQEYKNGYNGTDDSPNNRTVSSGSMDDNAVNGTLDHTLNRSGNVGVTTNQQMLESEWRLRKHVYFEEVFNDIASELTTDTYDLEINY